MNILKSLITMGLAALPLYAGAQTFKYIPEVKSIYEKADAEASPSPYARPLIGVTEPSHISPVVSAGGVPVTVSTDITDFNTYRDLAASLDGFIISSRFDEMLESELASSAQKAPAALLLKALMDRNVPMLGMTQTIRKIGDPLKYLPYELDDIPALVKKAATYRQAKAVMDRCFTLDTHSDLPGRFHRGYEIAKRSFGQISLQRMTEGGLDGEFLIAYVGGGDIKGAGAPKAYESANKELQAALKDIAANPEYCGLALCPADAMRLRSEGKKAFFVAVENGYALGHDIKRVKEFYDEGVRYITLSHMYDNDICHTSHTRSEDTSKGLTEFGKQVVAEMNRLGILVDVSHTSVGTFWDVLKYSKVPFVCSHSGAYAVYPHNRNLTDEQLRALAKRGGVIQVYIVDDYMVKDVTKISINEFMAHLLHCIDVAGIDHVGIGSDLDGGGGGYGLNGANDMVNITVRLLEAGFSEADIQKLWGGNFFRVMDEVQAYAAAN